MKTRYLIPLLLLPALFFAIGCSGNDDDDDHSQSDDDQDDDDDTATDDDSADDDQVDDDTIDDDVVDDDVFDPTGYVDPFIGTAVDYGQLSPAATLPFGMVKLGPDTLVRSHSGYDYKVKRITGFSHTRIEGVGCNGAGGDVRIMPGIGAQTTASQALNKETEVAQPGYYAAEIGDDGALIQAEMTVTEHAGLHRYVFPDSAQAYLYLNFNDPLADRIGSEWAANEMQDGIDGWVSAKNVCNEGAYLLYFSIKFSRAFNSLQEMTSIRGGKNARLDFNVTNGEPLLVKVGLSSVSAEEARLDRDGELPDWDFDAVREQAKETWRQSLATVQVEGDEESLTLFYTFLYRSLLTPVNATTHSGQYRGTDGEVHEATGYRHHHGWSLWDTYRNKFALISMLDPARSGEIMQSLVDLYLQSKVDWSTEHEPYPNVRTEHAVGMLLDAYAKGIEGFDPADAFAAILTEADTWPLDTPDKQLETSYDRWAIAQLAKQLGEQDTYEEYLALAAEYEDVWLDQFDVMGDDADVVHARGLYEGTLWQYRWAVVHDIPGMIALDGGREEFLGMLTQFFDEELYNHGNEPDIHASFLFNYVGAPWRTQDLVRQLLAEEVNQWYGTHEKWSTPFSGRIYRSQPQGLIPEMDDDDGTMSAWFVLASLGIYPVTIGQPIYVLTAPLFAYAQIDLGGGTTFNIVTEGVSAENRYIQSATLNGEALDRAWLWHEEIAAGGELVLQMGPEPNVEWGAAEANAPPPTFE